MMPILSAHPVQFSDVQKRQTSILVLTVCRVVDNEHGMRNRLSRHVTDDVINRLWATTVVVYHNRRNKLINNQIVNICYRFENVL